MKTKTQQQNSQKMKLACKEILSVVTKENPKFAKKSKSYKKRFLEISQETALPFSDIAASFFENGESDLGSTWTYQTIHGSFLYSNKVLQGFVIQPSNEQLIEMTEHLTEQTMNTARTCQILNTKENKNEIFYNYVREFCYSYFYKIMKHICIINEQLDEIDENNKWLNSLSGSVVVQAVRKYKQTLGEQA